MNKFFTQIVTIFSKLFGGDKNMELPKIEPPPVATPVVVEEPSKFVKQEIKSPYTLVAVRPTGVYGIGKVRFYPMASMDPRENLFGYLVKLADTIDLTNGKPFLNAQANAEISNLMLNPGGLPRNKEEWPAYADALNYPDDWRSQAQLNAMKSEAREDWAPQAIERLTKDHAKRD